MSDDYDPEDADIPEDEIEPGEDPEEELPGSEEEPGEAGARSGGPRLIIVDGAAVIRGSESLFEAWQLNPADAVLKLANVLSWAMAHQGAEFAVVVEPSALAPELEVAAAGIYQHSPSPGQTVSEAVMALAEGAVAEGRRVTVVTSDVDVLLFASQESIQSNLAERGPLRIGRLIRVGKIEFLKRPENAIGDELQIPSRRDAVEAGRCALLVEASLNTG